MFQKNHVLVDENQLPEGRGELRSDKDNSRIAIYWGLVDKSLAWVTAKGRNVGPENVAREGRPHLRVLDDASESGTQ